MYSNLIRKELLPSLHFLTKAVTTFMKHVYLHANFNMGFIQHITEWICFKIKKCIFFKS